jgi:hypothetical protein
MNLDLLSQLFAQIERAWFDDHDRTLVHRLSEEHPEFREQLYEFFEDIVVEPERQPSPEISEAEERVSEWLLSSGLDIGIGAAAQSRSSTTTGIDETGGAPLSQTEHSAGDKPRSTPNKTTENWLIFLRRRTRQTVPCLTSGLQHVTTEYLALISRHPNVVPMRVKTQIAQDVERAWRIPVQESLDCLVGQPSERRAASRSRPFEKEPSTFEEILDRSAFTPEQKAYWLQYLSSHK